MTEQRIIELYQLNQLKKLFMKYMIHNYQFCYFVEIGRFSIRASSRPHLQLKEHLDRENCDSNFIDQNISIK